MRGISFRWCEGRPKRTHNPEGNCQAVSRSLPRPPACVGRAIPVIAVTSYGLAGDDEKARAAGCDGYIAKPYSPRQLLTKVREYLSRTAAAR